MSTFDMPLTGIDPTNPIPGVLGEIRFAQGQAGGASGPKKILVLAPRTSSGSLTQDTVIGGPYSREADIITDTGAGSPAHRMAARMLKLYQGSPLYILCPTAATGTAAIDKVTITFSSGSAPGAVGVAVITICGVDCSFAFTTSDTVTTIAAGLVAAINDHTELPVTASNALGVITITGKITGEELNSIRFAVKTIGASTNVLYNAATSIADIPLGTSGAAGAAAGTGSISYTTALTTILASNFHCIVQVSQTGTVVKALNDQVDTQAQPSTGFRQHVFTGSALGSSVTDTTVNTLAAGSNFNRARGTIVHQYASPEEHYMLAANMAAVWLLKTVSDPSASFNSYGLGANDVNPFSAPALQANYPTFGGAGSIAANLNSGVTPIAVAPNGAAYVVRHVTTYCKNGANFDYRVRNSDVVTVGDRFTDDLTSKLALAPWSKITDDPASTTLPQPPKEFATPARVKAMAETLINEYSDKGWFDPKQRATMLSQLTVGIDPNNAGRMNVQANAYAAIWLNQMGVLVLESSPSL